MKESKNDTKDRWAQELVLCKEKIDIPLTRLIKKKKKEDPIKLNYKWKRRNYNWQKKYKDCKKLLRTTICQQIGQPGQNA